MKEIGFFTIAAVAVSAILAGCASNSETAFLDPEKLQQIRINKSTREQIRKIVGEPQSITTRSNETESWSYTKSHTSYTEKYAAKAALSFVPVPYLGTAVGLADKVADTGPDKIKETQSLTLLFDRKGILREIKGETKRD